jgi:hypothetical protein
VKFCSLQSPCFVLYFTVRLSIFVVPVVFLQQMCSISCESFKTASSVSENVAIDPWTVGKVAAFRQSNLLNM